MRAGLLAKFRSYEKLRALLLSTGTRPIIRHAGDSYWADGMDGTGQNWIGKLIMSVRDELKEQR
jgi:predicted NAD-dependent protein-ADP-ribosyltransferase YbiA (DUF1768 family)